MSFSSYSTHKKNIKIELSKNRRKIYDILNFILAHFDMKYIISRKLFF